MLCKHGVTLRPGQMSNVIRASITCSYDREDKPMLKLSQCTILPGTIINVRGLQENCLQHVVTSGEWNKKHVYPI